MSENFNQFFIKLENWKFEHFNHQVGIIDPVNCAYAVTLERVIRSRSMNLQPFHTLLADPQISQIQAFICQISTWDGSDISYGIVSEALWDAYEKFPNLKALFIGDSNKSRYRKSKLEIFDIRQILVNSPYTCNCCKYMVNLLNIH